MVAEQRITLATPLSEIVQMFHDKDVDLIDWDKGNKNELPTIRFHGDQAEGFKVVDIALVLGLWPIELCRVWYYRYELEKEPKWRLSFGYPPADGRYDDDQLALMVASLSYEPLHRTLPLGCKQLVPQAKAI